MSTAPPLILAFGDSLVAGYGLPNADGFAAQLERRLGSTHPGVRVVAGVAGDTTADALRRLPRVLSWLDRRPDLAIVQLGPNDVLRRLPPSLTRSNLDAFLTEFDRCGVRAADHRRTARLPAQSADAYASIHEEQAAAIEV